MWRVVHPGTRFSAASGPKHEHYRLLFRSETLITRPPSHPCLYSNWRLNSDQPWSRIERFNSVLARRSSPGPSRVPIADAHLHIFGHDNPVVLADSVRGLALVAMSDVGAFVIQLPDARFRLAQL
jgi:hypothetical protein